MANKKAERVEVLYQRLKSSHRDQWLYVNQRGYDFSNDNQLSSEEETFLNDSGMPDFTINRITPVVEMLNYYATANNPRWQAIGVDGSDADVAAVFSDMADYVWASSNGQTLLSNAVNDAITKSLGYLHITVDQNLDQGLGEVVLHQPDPFDVYVDPKSRNMLFKDAAYIMVKKMLPKSHLKKIYPDSMRKITKAASNDSEYSLSQRSANEDQKDILQTDITSTYDEKGEDDPLVNHFELYEKIKVAYINVFYKVPPSEEKMKMIRQQAKAKADMLKQELGVKLKEQQMQMEEAVKSGGMIQERYELEMKKATEMMTNQVKAALKEFQKQFEALNTKIDNKVVTEKEFKILSKDDNFSNMITDTIRFYDNRIRITCVVGDQLIYERILPDNIKDYPIVPIHYKWIGTPYPISAVSPLVGKQRELNKAHQLMIHNASLGSSLRWMYYEGSINEETWEKFSSSPGALLPVNHGYEPPKEVMPAQLSNAFFGIVNEGKSDMEYLAGIYSAQQGDTKATQDMPYRGMLAMDEYGTRRVKYWLKHSIEPSLVQIGEVVKQFSQATYTAHKVVRIVQPNAIRDSKEVEINKPLYNDFGKAVGKWNDYAAAKFDIRLVGGSTMPVNRWAYLQELKELAESGVIDPMAVLAETDIRNKEKIAERMSKVKQLQGQIGGLEEQVKDRDGTIETLERQLVQAGIKDKIRQAEVEISKKKHDVGAKKDKEYYRTDAETTLQKQNIKREADLSKRRMQDAVKMFEKSLQHTNNNK